MQFFNKIVHLQKLNPVIPKKNFWAWINIMFNRVDTDRLKLVGPDRLAIEWLMKNGACVRYLETPGILNCNYNALPTDYTKYKVTLKEIEADNSGIMHIGFDHLENCKFLDRISLKNCTYIDDLALEKLELRKDSLKILEIEKCRNITDHGLMQIKKLTKLQELRLFDLPYVKKPDACEAELKTALKGCKFDIKLT